MLTEKYCSGCVQNRSGNSVLKTLKLGVCQGKINETNWFLVCWYEFMKVKSYFNSLWVVVVRNEGGLKDLGTPKSSVSQGPIDEMSWFFVRWYKFGKAKSCFDNH